MSTEPTERIPAPDRAPDRTPDPWAIDAVEPQAATEEIERWRTLRTDVVSLARRHNLTKTAVTKRAGIPQGTFWQWFDGTYKGRIANVSDQVARFLESFAEQSAASSRFPTAPGYLETPTALKVEDALIFAQMAPEMVVVVLGAGMGKSITADAFVGRTPHATMVTMRPTTASVNNMLRALCAKFAVTERDPAKLDEAIGEKLKRNGRHTLLVVDEAQNLTDQAVNQLRFYLDNYGVGIALLGNEELYGRFGGSSVKPAYAQLHSRFGLRLRQLQPVEGDVEALLNAWGIEDGSIRKLMHAVARKPGALRHVTKVLQLGTMIAMGANRPLALEDVRAAIANRGLEG
jgi:DNA transposition AAA+ family ATPase